MTLLLRLSGMTLLFRMSGMTLLFRLSAMTHSPQHYGLFGLVVNNYWIGFSLLFAFELLGILLSYVFVLQNPNKKLFPLDFKGVPIHLKDDVTYTRMAALSFLYRDHRILPREKNKISFLPSARPRRSLSVIYTGENVLSKECLQAIDDIERWLTGSKGWENVSLTDKHGVIKKPNSVLRYFDGTFGSNLNDTKFANIPKILHAVYNETQLKDDLEKLISKDAIISPTIAKSTLTRSIFTISREAYPGMAAENYWEAAFAEKLVDLENNGRAGMKIYYFNEDMMFSELMKQVEKDIFLAFGSFLFILFFVLVQTQSVFITVFGIMSIIFSFMWTNYIYRVILDHTYFGIFHAMSIFIILGIGTDDLFVYYDMWRTTACMDLNTTQRRFTFCFRHASMSMLITSLTTAAAFVSNVFTPLYGICSFAVFTAILVMTNYVSAVLFFPMCVLVYHNNIARCPWPWKYFYPAPITDTAKRLQPNCIVKFFKGHFYSLISHKVFKWVFIIGCTGNGVLFAILASRLEISEKNVQFYRNGYNFQEALKLEESGFKQRLQDARLKIYIVFGLKEQDMSSCRVHDYNCLGIYRYDESLDLNPIPAQIALLNACRMLKTLDGHPNLHLAKDKRTKQNEVVCLLDNMNQFYTTHGLDSSLFKQPVNLSLPVSGIKFLNIAQVRRDLYADNVTSGDFYRFFETAVSYWLTNAYTGDYETGANFTGDVELSELLGVAHSEDSAPVVSAPHEVYGNKLRYLIIPIITRLVDGMTDFETGLAAFDAWENFTKSFMSKLPASIQGFQTTEKPAWHQFKMFKVLQESAYRGIILGTILAFLVLILATRNVILSFMATFNIILVIVTFAGCIKLLDVKISVIESINLSLVAGLSVDYVVHLSESYNHAPHTLRERKTRDMLEQMGVSVLSGAITTAGAASFMIHAQIYFFFQFGLFIMLTILLSLFYSLLWFTPLLTVIGPEEDAGSLVPLFQWIQKKWQPIQEELHAVHEEQKKMSYSRSICYDRNIS
ncbi:unnamed protein product [Candidula unifasciata]|uniref:SSD domain-containing protein n=1 Tax=Candidula unifasciata TaxID=100452 RepID=A0A8S3ZHV1_9EUPU|nr:unnamed protein product [Candidula unifasciata]